MKKFSEFVEEGKKKHTSDKDCKGSIGKDDVCKVCGVSHGDPCPDCGGRGYHEKGCKK